MYVISFGRIIIHNAVLNHITAVTDIPLSITRWWTERHPPIRRSGTEQQSKSIYYIDMNKLNRVTKLTGEMIL